MGIFRRPKGQHSNTNALPSDLIRMMERFGRYEFRQPGSENDGTDIWMQTQAPLLPLASADPDGFLVALARAVLQVGGWAVVGASRTIFEVISSPDSFGQHPSYIALMDTSLEFLRASGVPSVLLNGREEIYWKAMGKTMDTWVTWPPTPSQQQAPITDVLPNEVRRVAQLTSEADSNVIFVRQENDGRYCALIDSMWGSSDPRRVQREWQSAESLYELYIMIGRLLMEPPHWYDRELKPYFPFPPRKI